MDIANLSDNIVLTGDLDLSNTSISQPNQEGIFDSVIDTTGISVGIKISF